jgi:hypothetical protein
MGHCVLKTHPAPWNRDIPVYRNAVPYVLYVISFAETQPLLVQV